MVSIWSLMAVLILMDETVLLKLIYSADIYFSTTSVTNLGTEFLANEVSQSPNIAGYIVNAIDSPPELDDEILLLKTPHTFTLSSQNMDILSWY